MYLIILVSAWVNSPMILLATSGRRRFSLASFNILPRFSACDRPRSGVVVDTGACWATIEAVAKSTEAVSANAAHNPNTTDGAALANSIVLGQVIRSFYYFTPDGTLTPDKTFGTYEKTSDNPLTVKYTFSDKAKWSDGKPVDCDDAVLMWLANSGVTGDKGFDFASNSGFSDMAPPA